MQDNNDSKIRKRRKELQTNYDSLKEKLNTFLNTSNIVFESKNLIPTIEKKQNMLLQIIFIKITVSLKITNL